MKNTIIIVMLFIFAGSGIAHSDSFTKEQTEIKSFINKMYAIDPDTFEFGRFGAKYKNGEVIVRGKYNPDKQCQLLANFLVKEAVIEDKKDSGCLTGDHGYFRYPGLDGMDLGSATRTETPSQPQIKTPVVDGDKAKVYVKLKGAGDVFYYLRKLPEGWRIYRVEARESGENEDHIETGDTVFVFPPEKPVNK